MTIASGVSFAGQATAQSNRLKDVQLLMDQLQRQVTTGKKFDTMAGLGSDTHFVLQIHADKDHLSAYNANIDSALARIKVMDTALTETTKSVRQMLDTLQKQPGNGTYNITTINTQARNLLNYVVDLANTSIAGRYLFAGTDLQTQPIPNKAALDATMQAEMTDWLNGTNTTTQLLNNVDGFTGTTLGLSASISGAVDVTTRIDASVDLAYGAIADRSGVQEVVRALSMLANLRVPNPATDVPTGTDLDTVVNHAADLARAAVETVRNSQTTIASTLSFVTSLKETHTKTMDTYATLLEGKENVDPAEVIVKLQSIATQLNSSYEVTKMLSQLSLVNFLN